MAANYAEIGTCIVDKLETDFQQVLFVKSNFLKISQRFETSIIKNQRRKIKKKYSYVKKLKVTLLQKLHRSDKCLAVNLFSG